MAYLHGVKVISLTTGARPVNVVESAVIGLVSLAPKGDSNKLILVQNQQQAAANFGTLHPNNYMRMALDAIFAQGSATVLCVNIGDGTIGVETVTGESHAVTGGKIKLDRLFVGGLVVEYNTLVVSAGDYSFNPDTQEITIIDTTTYPDGTTLELSYDAIVNDVSSIASADIVGTVSGSTRTGMQLFELAYSQFGFVPRLLIAPYFSDRAAVATALISKAEQLRGHAIIDAPYGVTPTEVVAGRGSTAGNVKNFYTSSESAVLCYPFLKRGNPYSSENAPTEVVVPFSSYYAGVTSEKDNSRGFWYSPSNTEIKGITGVERVLTASLTDEETETNLLNSKGVTTVFASYGTGYRLWGNRSAAFPTNTAPTNFVPVKRTANILEDSLALASLQFIDLPLTSAIRDDIRETGNSFMRTLIQRGAVIDGNVQYIPANNPTTQLAAGQIVFDIEFMPPTPAELIVYQSVVNPDLLAALNVQ